MECYITYCVKGFFAFNDKNELIAHAGIYADDEKFDVIGGVITNPKYRGKGYGKKVLDDNRIPGFPIQKTNGSKRLF